MKFKFFIVFIIVCSIAIIQSDIPTHCLQHQIIGNWVFYQTEAVEKSLSELYQHKCGIKDHTKVSEINKFNMDKSLFKYSFEINLGKDHNAKISKSFTGFKGSQTGLWTMVYDEGFEFNLGKKDTSDFSSYFTFLKYSSNDHSNSQIKSKHYSHCYETLIGWFHTDKNKWGCFYGHKLVDNYKKPTNGEASDKLIVVENVVRPAFLEIQEKNNNMKMIMNSIRSERFMQTDLHNRLENKSTTNLKVTTRTFLTLGSEFTNHEEVVDRINSLNLSWKAHVYDEFKGKSIAQINKISGRKSKGGHYTRNYMDKNNSGNERRKDYKNPSKKITNRIKNGKNKNKSLKQINYTKFMGTPKSQGSCGSCFAVATNTMIEARLRLKYLEILKKYYNPNQFKISLEHILKCSYYNQGCHGGYSYLVSKFFKEFEMMTEDCFDEMTCSNKCKSKESKNSKLTLKVNDYYYVGKYYGYTNEENIYNDLRENGPLVISLAPNYLFSSYRSGIFDADDKTWKMLNLQKPEWEKVDHSVVLVGFGIENGIEYWLVQNSWGENWGDRGYMKIRKGKNLINIESLAEGASVTLFEN